MELFWKAIILSLAASILGLQLGFGNKQWTLLLVICAAVMAATAVITYLRPVLQLLRQIAQIGDIQTDFLRILLKALGIGITSEIAGQICTDAGNSSLGKTLQILTSAVILSLSVPVLSTLIEMLQQILEDI